MEATRMTWLVMTWMVIVTAGLAAAAAAPSPPEDKPFKAQVSIRSAQAKKRDHKDPTTQYMILGKESDSNKKTQAMCYSQGRCFLQKLTCPTECPRRTAGKKGSTDPHVACFIDCSPSKCQTSCRSRKAKCHGFGAVCYDPRFIGGDGVMFYFHGKSNENFCLVTDPDLHINARFIGTRPAGRSRDYTWIQSLGVMFDARKLSISAVQIPGPWDPAVDRLSITYDGQSLALDKAENAAWESNDVSVQRTDDVNSAVVVVNGLVQLDVSVVPITAQDNRVHNYQIDLQKDCFAHLDVQFRFFNLSAAVDGVLGQTYRPDFHNPVKVGVPMPVMGGHDKFFASSLFNPDCKVNLFHHQAGRSTAQELASSAADPAQLGDLQGVKIMDCSSSNALGGGLVCKR